MFLNGIIWTEMHILTMVFFHVPVGGPEPSVYFMHFFSILYLYLSSLNT